MAVALTAERTTSHPLLSRCTEYFSRILFLLRSEDAGSNIQIKLRFSHFAALPYLVVLRPPLMIALAGENSQAVVRNCVSRWNLSKSAEDFS